MISFQDVFFSWSKCDQLTAFRHGGTKNRSSSSSSSSSSSDLTCQPSLVSDWTIFLLEGGDAVMICPPASHTRIFRDFLRTQVLLMLVLDFRHQNSRHNSHCTCSPNRCFTWHVTVPMPRQFLQFVAKAFEGREALLSWCIVTA